MRHILRRSHRPVMLHIQRQQAQCEMRITGVLQGSQQMRQQTKILTLRSQNDQPPALEFRSEGLVMGVGARMFAIAGPVLAYGISAAVLYGLVLCLFFPG